jgi:hypothetical protein
VPRRTRHHLFTRTRLRKKRKAGGRAQRAEARAQLQQTAMLCRACHTMIHAVLTERQLEARYHTLESLRRHPEIARFIGWVRRQPVDRNVAVRWPRRRRETDRADPRKAR